MTTAKYLTEQDIKCAIASWLQSQGHNADPKKVSLTYDRGGGCPGDYGSGTTATAIVEDPTPGAAPITPKASI